MLKERTYVSDAVRIGHFECSRLDTESEALPNDGQFGKGSRNAAVGRGRTLDYKRNCSAWRKRYTEAFLAISSGRLLTMLAATEIAVLQWLWELAADQSASGLFCA